MTRFILSLLIFVFIGTVESGFSQIKAGNRPDTVRYNEAEIYFVDNSLISVTGLTLYGEFLSYTRTDTRQPAQGKLSDVLMIRVVTGNRAGLYTLLGALIGASSAAIGIATIPDNPPFTKKPDAAPFIGGFAAGGALIGLAVGAASDEWETVFTREGENHR